MKVCTVSCRLTRVDPRCHASPFFCIFSEARERDTSVQLTPPTVLTSRKYGVATVWLVATLGSKSTLKRVSRKAILDVDVQKACETIVTPEAPMALRLQSNLLFVQLNKSE